MVVIDEVHYSRAGQYFDSDRDLLGDYEFNPFVDEELELDYDEDMEDTGSAQPEAKADSEEDSKEEDGLCAWSHILNVVMLLFVVCIGAVTEDKEVEEVSSVSAGSVSPSKPGKGKYVALCVHRGR